MKVKISLVDYLNSAPLGWAFLHGPFQDRFEVIRSSPASCADQLMRGEVEVGLIPSIEYQRIPDLAIIPGISVSARCDVRSVLLVRRKSAKGPIRCLALDSSSRTSATLLRILLRSRMKLEPQLIQHEPDLERMLNNADAALLIGDAALQLSGKDYQVTDLAEEWVRWQSMPFVFAFWACRADRDLPADLVGVFQAARTWGLDAREEIIRSYGPSLSLPVPLLHEYLSRNIDYSLGSDHLAGLERFYRLAQSHGFIRDRMPLRFCR